MIRSHPVLKIYANLVLFGGCLGWHHLIFLFVVDSAFKEEDWLAHNLAQHQLIIFVLPGFGGLLSLLRLSFTCKIFLTFPSLFMSKINNEVRKYRVRTRTFF